MREGTGKGDTDTGSTRSGLLSSLQLADPPAHVTEGGVDIQNTAELIDALVKANVQFDLGIYPKKNHGIYGGNTRLHLYTKMTNFILENL